MNSAARQRAYRRRRDRGAATFRLVLDEVAVAEMLVAGGLLADRDRDDQGKVEAALTAQLEQLINISVTHNAAEFFERLRFASSSIDPTGERP
jgi:hypothetical protein